MDEPFRKLFFRDAPTALDGYRLTPQESAAIRDLDHEQLDQFAESLVSKRRKRVERAFPLLFALSPAEMRRYYARFYQLFGAKPYQASHQDALDFGVFVEEALVEAEHLPAYASELARYERLYFSTRLSLGGAGDVPPAREEVVPDTPVDLDARPSLRPDVTIADFAYDIGAIEEQLQNGEVPDDAVLASERCSIIFRPGTGSSDVQMLRINAATRAVVDRCDGRHSVRQVIADIEAALGAGNLHDRIVETVGRLVAAGVLTRDGAGAAPPPRVGSGYAGATEVESL